MACRDETPLTIVEPIVDDGGRLPGKHLARPREIQAAMLEREIAFRLIERDPHLIYCTPNKLARQSPYLVMAGLASKPP